MHPALRNMIKVFIVLLLSQSCKMGPREKESSDDNNNILHRVRAVRSPISEIVPALDLLEQEIIKRPQLKEYTNPKSLTLLPESAATTEPMTIMSPGSTMARPSTMTPRFIMNHPLTITPQPTRTLSSNVTPILTMTPTSTMAPPLTTMLPLSTTFALTMAPSYTLATTPILMWSPTSTITGPSTITPSSSTTLASTLTPPNSNDNSSLNKCLKEVGSLTATTDAMYSALLLLEKTMDCEAMCRKVCYITKESCAKKQTPTSKSSKMPKNVAIWSEITTASNEMLIRDWLLDNFTDKKTKQITNSMPSVIEPDAIIASKMQRSGTVEQHMCERNADCSQLREPVAYCNWNSWARPYKGAPLHCKCRNNYCVIEIQESSYTKLRYCVPSTPEYFCPKSNPVASTPYPVPANREGKYFSPGIPTTSLVRCRNDFDCQKSREPRSLCAISNTWPKIRLLSKKCRCDALSNYCLLEFEKPDLQWTFCVMQSEYDLPCDNPPLIEMEAANYTSSLGKFFPINQRATRCSSDNDCLFLREPSELCLDAPPRKRRCYCRRQENACVVEFHKFEPYWTFCVKLDAMYQSQCRNKPLIKPVKITIIRSRPAEVSIRRRPQPPVFTIFDLMKYPQMQPSAVKLGCHRNCG